MPCLDKWDSIERIIVKKTFDLISFLIYVGLSIDASGIVTDRQIKCSSTRWQESYK